MWRVQRSKTRVAQRSKESARRVSTLDPPLSRLARLRGSGTAPDERGAAGRGAAGERDNRADVFAARSTQRRAAWQQGSSFSTGSIIWRAVPLALAARRASPHRPLFYCQPTILTCARNVRSTKVFMEISFRMRLARPLARERQYKSTITNGRVN